MAGSSTLPVPAASATPEPDMPAMIMLATTDTCARPPVIWPTRVRAKETSRSVMPPVFIRLPARMKNGIASRGKVSIPPIIRWTIPCKGTCGAEDHVRRGGRGHGPGDGRSQREEHEHDDEEPGHHGRLSLATRPRRLSQNPPRAWKKISAAEKGTTAYTAYCGILSVEVAWVAMVHRVYP